MNAIEKLCMLVLLAMIPAMAVSSETGFHLDKAPVNLNDKASLQRGAKFFIANCLSCHSASYMRYNRLNDIGMADDEIKPMLPEGNKLGSTMQATIDVNSARLAFGVTPPDMSVIARARGQDWLYTYLRSFYADSKRSSGINNAVLPDVGMPNVLIGLQGEQELRIEKHGDSEIKKLVLTTPGSMKPEEFDKAIGDLTSFMVYMGDPSLLVRHKIGYIVLGFLFVFLVLIYALKVEIWKDVRKSGD